MFKVLYVEDDFQSYKLVEMVLRKHNIETILASDGLQAIELTEKIVPDLIIMDINLPKLKGYEAAAIIRANKATNHIPIIALTAVSDSNYEKLSFLAGCDAFYTKPIDPLKFGEDIVKFIQERQFEEKEIDFFSKIISTSLKDKTEEVVKLEKELSNFSYRLNKILSSLPDSVFIVDKDFTIKYLNTAALEIKVLDHKFIDTNFFFDIFSLIDFSQQDLIKELETKDRVSDVYLTLNTESNKHYIGSFSFIEDDYLITIKEITDMKKFEKHMEHVEKLASIGQITSSIIHEINNPLTAIKNYLSVLKNSSNDEQMAHIIDRIEFGIDRIHSLSENLMAFSRKTPQKKSPINLNHIIKEVLAFSEYEIKRGNVNIETKLNDNLPLIYGNKTSLEQVVLNLLINANHAVKEIENPKIEILTYEENSSVFLEIKDNGCGIPNDIKDKIFEPFFTTKDEGHGTGLGLAIVKKIVDEHGGKIFVESSAGQTIFKLQFSKFETKEH